MTRPAPTTASLSSQRGAGRLARAYPRRALSGGVLGALLLGGLLGATAPSGGASAGQRPVASGVHGSVNLTIWSVDSDGPDFQVILSGAIGDFGTAVTVLPDGKVDPEHASEMELGLGHGTFRLYIDGIAGKFRAKTAHEPVYAVTCSDYFHVSATVPVVRGSGTVSS